MSRDFTDVSEKDNCLILFYNISEFYSEQRLEIEAYEQHQENMTNSGQMKIWTINESVTIF